MPESPGPVPEGQLRITCETPSGWRVRMEMQDEFYRPDGKHFAPERFELLMEDLEAELLAEPAK